MHILYTTAIGKLDEDTVPGEQIADVNAAACVAAFHIDHSTRKDCENRRADWTAEIDRVVSRRVEVGEGTPESLAA